MSVEGLVHGHGGYSNGGCRCEVCKAAQRAYSARWYRRKNARERREQLGQPADRRLIARRSGPGM